MRRLSAGAGRSVLPLPTTSPGQISAPRPPRHPLACSAAATAWADGLVCAGAKPGPRCSPHRFG
ncbi:SUFU negative regulator of hedgehog signaling [Phyllostomus discolor]|uniref:SUFU negative regulator of hedgehog signaling n=1 Tax=Phyllostomus discolor TaxID=89673 RepID=A0A834ABI4_9CHIR|nr:SUFU negative regulator of hedgehog signaling [Phyllostomus discolor]